MRRSAAVTAFLAVFLGVSAAQAATIDFTAPNQNITATPYVEDGFVVDMTSTNFSIIFNNQLQITVFGPGQFFSISREGGGLFGFRSFDFRSAANLPADGFRLLGLLSGAQVADFGSFDPTSAVSTTETIADGTLIDELRVVGTGGGFVDPIWDNFVLDPVAVPLPPTAALLVTGLIVLGASARRRR